MNIKFLPILLILALANSSIELEISAPSFPEIKSFFGVSESIVGLTITYNLIGFCIASLIYGPLSESYGRRKIMLIGNGILTIGAIACTLATDINILLAARFIQGIGAATSATIVSAIIADVYTTSQATRIYSIMNAICSILIAISPELGSFININFCWRANYGIVAIICLISWINLYFFLTETHNSYANFSIKNIFHNYKQVLSNLIFLSSTSIPSMLYGCYMAFVMVSTFIYTQMFLLDMFSYGMHQCAVISIFSIMSTASCNINKILGIRRIMWSCILLANFSSIAIIFSTSSFILTIFMSIFAACFALIYPIVFAYSINIFPELKGTASSATMGIRYLLCSLITGTVGYFYDGSLLSLGVVMTISMLIITLLAFRISKHIHP